MAAKKGLYANIQAKKKRIASGSGEKMRKPGAPGAPESDAFEKAAETAKKPAAKKRVAKKAATKKPAVKKSVAKKTTAKKPAVKKPS